MLLLTACASSSTAVPTSPDINVPGYLLEPCDHPVVDVRDNKGLAQGLGAYKAALDSCNSDKETVKDYLDGLAGQSAEVAD